jgi:hypothetical protein
VTEYDADVQHLAEYILRGEPYTVDTAADYERLVHSLASAVQRTIAEWILEHPEIRRREVRR